MKVSGIDYVDEDDRTIIYFTAAHRVDFRALVRDLSATLHSRVELRQLSARDEAKLTGGLGSCGRDLCCSTFLVDFEPVSVRMAKEQGLPLNPLRISGACGRLMCCLKYEHPLYQAASGIGRGRHPARRSAPARPTPPLPVPASPGTDRPGWASPARPSRNGRGRLRYSLPTRAGAEWRS